MCSKIKTALKISNPQINTNRLGVKTIKFGSNEFPFDYIVNNKVTDKIANEYIDNIFDDSNSTFFTYGSSNTGKSETIGIDFFKNVHGLITKCLVELFVRIDKEEEFFKGTKHTVLISLLEVKDNKCSHLLYPTQVNNLYSTIMLLDREFIFQFESHVILSVKLKRAVSKIQVFERSLNFVDLHGAITNENPFLRDFLIKKFVTNKPVISLERNNLVKNLNKFFSDAKVLLLACVDLYEEDESYDTMRFAVRFSQNKSCQVLDETIEWTDSPLQEIEQHGLKKRSNESFQWFHCNESIERIRSNVCHRERTIEYNKSVYEVKTPLPCIKPSQLDDSADVKEVKTCEIQPQSIEDLDNNLFEWTWDESKVSTVEVKKGEKRKCDNLEFEVEQLKKRFRLMTVEINNIMDNFTNDLESIF